MPYPIILHEQAHLEYIDSYEWYELQQPGLGDRFKTNVEKCLAEISEHPEYFNRRNGNYRVTKVKGFPYVIVFEFFKRKQVIHISAIYHGKRNPRKRYRRIKK